jgi:hypothetical protein
MAGIGDLGGAASEISGGDRVHRTPQGQTLTHFESRSLSSGVRVWTGG